MWIALSTLMFCLFLYLTVSSIQQDEPIQSALHSATATMWLAMLVKAILGA
jgi:hypothetical protein